MKWMKGAQGLKGQAGLTGGRSISQFEKANFF